MVAILFDFAPSTTPRIFACYLLFFFAAIRTVSLRGEKVVRKTASRKVFPASSFKALCFPLFPLPPCKGGGQELSEESPEKCLECVIPTQIKIG